MSNRCFDDWWREVGSGIRPEPFDDHQEHARRIAELACKACIAELESKVERLAALPEKWRSDEFSIGDMDNYSGACADELEAALEWENDNE